MKRIYEVIYLEKWAGCGNWIEGKTSVFANGDAQKAINKVKRKALQGSYKLDDGKTCRCTGFKLKEVRLLAEGD